MDLPVLRAFVVLAEELHFGRAALRLELSQPQVSRRVRALEEELGVDLFVRTPRHTTLTDTGRRLLEDARETLAAADRLQARARAAAGTPGGRVAVGFVWSTLGAYLAPLVAATPERHPDIELSVSQKRFVEIVPALRRGDVDLVVSRTLLERGEMIEILLRREPSFLAVPVSHPFAGRATVQWTELEGEPMVALARALAPSLFDAVLQTARERGFEPNIAREARSPGEALALVSAGLGIYRLPSSAAPPHPGIVYCVLEDVPSRLVMLRRPEPPSPAIAAVAQLIQDLFSDASNTSNDGAAGLELSDARA
ncbi:MAG: LysR substrate-binding domain-containing protein [Solirubrobacteraceae bacterium]